MEPDIRNFKGLEDLIRKRPKEADKLAAEWDRFVKIHPQDRMFFTTRERFFAWAEKHPQLHIDTSIWVGKEVIEAYSYVREQREERQELDKQLGLPAGPSPSTLADFANLPFLAAMYLNKPKIMQNDGDYKAILEGKKQEWLEKNPGKDFTSKEGLDYLYGSLENSDKPPIDQETEEEFRANKKFAGKVKRYDKEKAKIYKNPDDDPQLRKLREEIDQHTQARFAYFQKINPAYKLEDVRRSVERRSYLMFAYQYEDKAKQYAQSNDRIKAALEIKKTEQMARPIGQEGTPQWEQPKTPFKPSLRGTFKPSLAGTFVRGQGAETGPPFRQDEGTEQPQEQPQQSSPPQTGGGPGGRSRGMDLANRFLPKKKKPPLPKTPGNPLDKLRNRLLLQAVRFLLGFLFGSTPFIIFILVLLGVFVLVGFGPIDLSGGIFRPQTDINQCTFTRGPVGNRIKSFTLQNWITEAAKASGVPAPILASIAMHESADFTANADDDHDDIKSGKYCHPGLESFCESGGKKLHSGDCTPDDPQGSRTGRAMGLMQVVDVYNKDIDACDIKQNLKRGAEIFKGKLSGEITNENAVKTAVCRYFGIDAPTCLYNNKYDYGQEVWNDYQKCQLITQPGELASCPVPGAKITYGSYGTGPKAHCTEAFEGCKFGPNGELPRRAKSIDIDTQGQEAIFPTINGEKIDWYFLSKYDLDTKRGDCEKNVTDCGAAFVFGGKTKDNAFWTLHLVHLDKINSLKFNFGVVYESGQPAGKTAKDVVLHINIGKNITPSNLPGSEDLDPGWIKPEDIGMCTK